MKRDIYFLKDSVSGLFYTGQSNWVSDLKDAAIYHREKNAIEHIKGIVQAWEHYLKYPVDEKYRREFEVSMKPFPNDEVKKRKDLEKWGIVVVKGTVKI